MNQHQFSFLLLFLLLPFVHSLIHHNLRFSQDTRPSIFIQSFGFFQNGHLSLTISHLSSSAPNHTLGFYIRQTDSERGTLLTFGKNECPLQSPPSPDTTHTFDSLPFTKDIKGKEEGLYYIWFVNCNQSPVSFNLHMEAWNEDAEGNRIFLSAGDEPLPRVYALFTFLYVILLGFWCWLVLKKRGNGSNRLHGLMAIFLFLKMASLLCRAMEYHFLKETGRAEGWNILFYIFAFMKGLMFFVVLALMGMGWSFVKPYLNDKDKKILLFVLPLQVLANVALVVVDEVTPSSRGWMTWLFLVQIVDIVCCGAILLPIIWSIQHLKEASETDGKAAKNLQKLKLFRQFYLMVVAYIYFTRIIVNFMASILAFHHSWIAIFASELASFLFFLVTGWKFRPGEDNEYFGVSQQPDVEMKDMASDD